MIRAAKNNDVSEIVEVLVRAFKTERINDDTWEELRKSIPQEIKEWRVLVINGKIIGALHIRPNWLRIGKSCILNGDVGWVSVLPEYQGAGHGSELMRDAVTWMRDNGYDLSRLGGLRKFYGRFGYLPFPRRYVEFTVGSKVPAGASMVEEKEITIDDRWKKNIRLFDEVRDFPSQQQLAEKFKQVYTGHLESVHQKAPKHTPTKKEPSCLKIVFAEKKQIAGYLFATLFEKEKSEFEANITINEMGYDPNKPYVLQSLISYVNNYALQKGIRRITARLPFDPRIFKVLLDIPIRFQAIETYEGKAGNMLQIVNLGSLFQKLIPEFKERLKNSPEVSFNGVLEIQTEKESVQLEIIPGKIKMVTNQKPDTQVRVSEFYLIQLVLGLLSFAELTELLGGNGNLKLPEITLLKNLFPRRCVFSGTWG